MIIVVDDERTFAGLGCYAVIEDGTYGQLQALRIYKEECHDD